MKRGSLRKSLWNRILVFMMVLTMTSVHLTPAIPAMADTLESTEEQGSGEEKAEKEESSEKEEKEEKAESSEKEEKEEKAESSEKEEKEEKSESSEKEEADTSEKEEKAEASEKEEASDKSDAAEASESSEDNSSNSAAHEEATAQEEKGSDPAADTADKGTSAESTVEIVKADDAQASSETDAAVSVSQASEKEETSEEIAAPADTEKSEAPAEKKAEAAPAISAPAENVTITADGLSTIIAAPGAEKALTANIGPAAETTNVQEVKAESDKNEVSVEIEKQAAAASAKKAEAPVEKKSQEEKGSDKNEVSAVAETTVTEQETNANAAVSEAEAPKNEVPVRNTKALAVGTKSTDGVSQDENGVTLDFGSESNSLGMMAMALAAPAITVQSTEPEKENLTVHISNILWTAVHAENGHAVAYEAEMDMVKGQSKGINGFKSYAGGNNNSAGGLGYTYKFLNVFAVTTKDSEPVCWNTASDGDTVKQIKYSSDGKASIVMNSGQTIQVDGKDVYISPVYKATANWYLNYNYIDNISTGSGSWSNKDAVTEYKHTFSDPSIKTPQSDYQFEYWQNDETGVKFYDGDENIYSSAEIPKGTTKNVNIYAYWQPAITVNFNEFGTTKTVDKSFESVDVKGTEVKSEHEHYQFLGWYGEDKSPINGDEAVDKLDAPEITKDENTALNKSVDAWWQPSITVNYLDAKNGSVITVENEDAEIEHANIESFDDIDVDNNKAEKTAQKWVEEMVLGSNNTLRFLGWFVKKDDTGAQSSDNETATRLRSIPEEPVALADSFKEAADGTAGKLDIDDLEDDQNVSGGILAKLSATKDRVVQSAVSLYAEFATWFSVNKTWNDDNDRDGKRPESIQVQLMANDKEEGTPITLTKDGDWKYTFDNLKAFDDDGNLIKYSIRELAVADYTSEVNETLLESENERVNGLVKAVEITNTHAPEKIEFTISKTWEDENNKDNIRPDSIEVSILADGEVVKTVEISSKEDWEKVVGDMYRYAEGKEIEYTVAEAAVEGYEATISGSAGNGFGINNVHEPAPAQDPTEDPTPSPAPNNGGNSGRRSNNSERTYSYSAGPAVLVASNEPAVESAVLGADREPEIEESAVLGADREPQQGVLGADRLPQTGQLWWPIPILLIAGAGLLSAGVVRRREDD
ncbi:MAG: Cna B-type domain-containing protein [Lachnospiraceae bacterium]|nr:Cna B-type domain-containing protein [Lachnospiraceae bacterium]